MSKYTLTLGFLAAATCAVQANAQQPAKTTSTTPQAPAVKTTAQPAPAAGMVVFIDPATGKIRQPDASEIGELTGAAAGARNAVSTPATPTMIQGPGGAIGMMLGEDSMSYMVVTKTPDGKLAEDCVTGDKAAAAALSKGATPKTTPAPKKPAEVLDVK